MDFKKLKIKEGNDMYPSIHPDDILLLETKVEPKIGDVILFKNRFNLKIAHRLIYKIGKFYFTKGDNCIVFNFPEEKTNIEGVIVGKYKQLKVNLFIKISLNLFLVYFLIFNLKNKRRSLLLKFISKYIAPKDLTIYNQDTLKNLKDY